MRGSFSGAMRQACAAAIWAIILTSTAAAQQNCPTQSDQAVIVPVGRPVAFRLLVNNLGEGGISIFQYPAGGILEQTGPSPLDFVFVPQLDFRGTTAFTYRLTPPSGCPRNVVLGRVTLAGGNAGSLAEQNETTASGVVDPPAQPGLFDLVAAGLISSACGVGIVPMGLIACVAMLIGKRRMNAKYRPAR